MLKALKNIRIDVIYQETILNLKKKTQTDKYLISKIQVIVAALMPDILNNFKKHYDSCAATVLKQFHCSLLWVPVSIEKCSFSLSSALATLPKSQNPKAGSRRMKNLPL